MKLHGQYILDGIISSIHFLPVTIELVFVSLFIGLLFGTAIGFIRYHKIPVLSQVFAVLVTMYQGIPVLVVLLIFHLLFLNHMGEVLEALHLNYNAGDINPVWIGILALSLMAISNFSEVIRGALHGIDQGQTEAGYSVGLTRFQIIRRIIIPQLVPIALPPITNNIVGLIKASSLASLVGIIEVTGGAIVPAATTYAFFESYLAAACVYWVFSACLEFILNKITVRVGRFRRAI